MGNERHCLVSVINVTKVNGCRDEGDDIIYTITKQGNLGAKTL